MTFSDNVPLHLALKLNEKGYNKYANKQYIEFDKDLPTHSYKTCNLTIEDCAVVELCSDHKFIYAPTYDEAYQWILEKDSAWNLSVLWNNVVNGFYFVVQNIDTGYEYKQPATPGQLNSLEMYAWGMEHILNRIDEPEEED